MYKILPIILILTLFSLAGCKKERMYEVGQVVCVTNNLPYPRGYPYPVGEIFRITEEKIKMVSLSMFTILNCIIKN